MKLLKKWLGKETKTPVWNVTPAAERPAPRKAAQPEAPETPPDHVATNPFLTDAFNKFELADETDSNADPYQTHSWDTNARGDQRKLKSSQTDGRPRKREKEAFNPYDTGVFRRGWKD